MKESRTGKKAVLIGNGINQLDSVQSISWGKLLEEIKKDRNIEGVDLLNDFKPFPLAFEELTHRKPGHSNISEKVKILKSSIARIIKNLQNDKLGYNEYHKKITETNIEHILTTNYGYGFEKSSVPNFMATKRNLAIDKTESKYSLKRGYKIAENKTNVWHIHGELEHCRKIGNESKNYKEESILIGYDHYTKYLENIQSNISGRAGRQKHNKQSVWNRIRDNNIGEYWTDFFFTHDLYIFGIGLDFSENHLWWLLNKRAGLMKNNPNKKKLYINNRITYLYPYIENSNLIDVNNDTELILKKRNSLNKANAVSGILPAFNVEVEKIKCNSYKEFYDKVINRHLN